MPDTTRQFCDLRISLAYSYGIIDISLLVSFLFQRDSHVYCIDKQVVGEMLRLEFEIVMRCSIYRLFMCISFIGVGLLFSFGLLNLPHSFSLSAFIDDAFTSGRGAVEQSFGRVIEERSKAG